MTCKDDKKKCNDEREKCNEKIDKCNDERRTCYSLRNTESDIYHKSFANNKQCEKDNKQCEKDKNKYNDLLKKCKAEKEGLDEHYKNLNTSFSALTEKYKAETNRTKPSSFSLKSGDKDPIPSFIFPSSVPEYLVVRPNQTGSVNKSNINLPLVNDKGDYLCHLENKTIGNCTKEEHTHLFYIPQNYDGDKTEGIIQVIDRNNDSQNMCLTPKDNKWTIADCGEAAKFTFTK